MHLDLKPRNVSYRWIITAFFLLIATLGTLPLLRCGFWPFGYDAECAWQWSFHFSRQFWNGELYPRWLTGMNGGLGSPTFFYYGPMPFWITSVLRLLVPYDPYGWYCLAVSACMALLLSGVFFYKWLREYTSVPAAVAGAAIYQVIPYHLAVDLYVRRGSFAEFWSFVWLPLIMLFAHRLAVAFQRKSASLAQAQGVFAVHSVSEVALSFCGLALSYAGLALNHLPSIMVFSWVPVLYALSFSETSGDNSTKVARRQTTLRLKKRLRLVSMTLAAMGLGTGVAAIYLIPALTTQDYVSIPEMVNGNQYYENHFLTLSQLRTGSMLTNVYLAIGTSVIAAVVSVVGGGLCARLRFVPASFFAGQHISLCAPPWPTVKFWLLALFAATFMTFPASKPVYLLLPKLQMIQFPWRFGIPISFAVATLVALSADMVLAGIKATANKRMPYIAVATISVIYCIFVGWIWMAVASSRVVWGVSRPGAENIDLRHPEVIEYRTSWAVEHWAETLNKIGKPLSTNIGAHFLDGKSAIALYSRDSRTIKLTLNTSTPATVLVHHFYYPGWIVTDQFKKIVATPSYPEGLIEFVIPGGRHNITLLLEAGKWEKLGARCSSLSVAVIVWIIVSSAFKQLR